MRILHRKELPSDAQTFSHHRAEYFGVVMLFGVSYYIPVTEEMKRLFKLKQKPYSIDVGSGKREFYANSDLESFFRDMTAAIYYQVRDTVGEEVRDSLSKEIKDGFERFYSKGLGNLVEKRLEDKGKE